MAVREYLVTELTPLLPRGWRLVAHDTNLDTLSKPVLMLKLQSLEPLTATPRTGLTVEYVVTIITPHTDVQKAEDDLDDLVIDTIAAIRKIKNVVWKSARRVLFGANQAFDITIEITS